MNVVSHATTPWRCLLKVPAWWWNHADWGAILQSALFKTFIRYALSRLNTWVSHEGPWLSILPVVYVANLCFLSLRLYYRFCGIRCLHLQTRKACISKWGKLIAYCCIDFNFFNLKTLIYLSCATWYFKNIHTLWDG